MIRRDAWETLGGFDEDFYPLWFEDVDFLKRAKDNWISHPLRAGGCGETYGWSFHPKDFTGVPAVLLVS